MCMPTAVFTSEKHDVTKMKIFITHYKIVFWGNWTQFKFSLGNIFVENVAKHRGSDKEHYMWNSFLTVRY